jgi:6-pyruvoyltetrahydropterin/6-carboxytetrahydropterin synthase
MMFPYYPQVQHSFIYELNKDMSFAAAHFIPAEEAGNCSRTHGHTYVVNVTIGGDELDETGFLVDFKAIKQLICDRYDHTLLNEHPEFRDHHPTTEALAHTISLRIGQLLTEKQNRPQCLQVIVRETPTSYVVYRPKPVI